MRWDPAQLGQLETAFFLLLGVVILLNIRRWRLALVMVLLMVVMVWFQGCAPPPPLPPVPPPAEDLSTWTVPELITPAPEPEPPKPTTPVPVEDKPTAAERVYAFTPGATFQVPVVVDIPLDLVLERGEEVRNIVGGDRAPAEAQQTPRWEVKEGTDGQGDTLRHHVFLTASAPELTDVAILSRTHGNKDMTPHTRCVR